MYLPDWGDVSDYRFENEAAWEIVLDESSGLNLKFAFTDRFDSTPDGAKKNDINYSLLLLWNL